MRKADGSIATRIYHKPTWTGQYANFHSFVPITYKRNLVRNLANRIFRLTSTELQEDDIRLLKVTLGRNGYPKAFLEKHCKAKEIVRNNADTTTTVPLRIQFRGDGAAEVFKQKVNRTIRQACPTIRVRYIFTSRTLMTLQTKDRLTFMATFNVYSLTTK